MAVVVLLTPGEVAYLRPEYGSGDSDPETSPASQPRPKLVGVVQRGSRARRFIGYPTDRMLAVVGDAGQAAAAAASIRAAGIPDRDITLLRGSEGADRLDGTGAANGVLARIRRLTSFTLMDQLVDMAAYERAVRDGSVVLMVRVRGDALKAAVLELLRVHGAHFVNYYGRFATEELERWHGAEPDIPELMRR